VASYILPLHWILICALRIGFMRSEGDCMHGNRSGAGALGLYRTPRCGGLIEWRPRYRDGRHGEPDQLAGCYRSSLDLAVAHGVRTIAFPAISCGIYGYPIPDAARIAIGAVAQFRAADETIQQVMFACFGPDVLAAFETAARARSHFVWAPAARLAS
jgi:hypothetical protein